VNELAAALARIDELEKEVQAKEKKISGVEDQLVREKRLAQEKEKILHAQIDASAAAAEQAVVQTQEAQAQSLAAAQRQGQAGTTTTAQTPLPSPTASPSPAAQAAAFAKEKEKEGERENALKETVGDLVAKEAALQELQAQVYKDRNEAAELRWCVAVFFLSFFFFFCL
jgi:hypothetical protein